MTLERMGVPTALICSSEFAALGANERVALGMPGLPIVVVPHPVGGIPPERAGAMGDGVADEVRRILTTDAETTRRAYRGRAYAPPRGTARHKTIFA